MKIGKKQIYIGLGAVAVGLVGYYLYTKNKSVDSSEKTTEAKDEKQMNPAVKKRIIRALKKSGRLRRLTTQQEN